MVLSMLTIVELKKTSLMFPQITETNFFTSDSELNS